MTVTRNLDLFGAEPIPLPSVPLDPSSTVVLGVDEAGRGPALGPLVLAVVGVSPRAAARLTRAGLTDSKAFGSGEDAHAIRCELAELVREVADYVAFEVFDVATIDAYVGRGALNVLEREGAERLLRAAPPARRIIADGRTLFSPMRVVFPGLEARDRAETFHAAVAAASVVAKVERDNQVAAIASRYLAEFGPLRGGGYVNEGTRAFVRAYIATYGCLPPEARRSWPWTGVELPASETLVVDATIVTAELDLEAT